MWGSGWAYGKPGGIGVYVRSGMMLVAFSGGVGTEGRVLRGILWWREWWGDGGGDGGGDGFLVIGVFGRERPINGGTGLASVRYCGR